MVKNYNSTFYVERFINLVDTLTEIGGLNVRQIVEIEKLKALPSGTFGRSLADFLDRHNLKLFTTGIRRKQLHDAVHVLTDYGVDPLGEAEVQAFLLGAKFRLLHLALALGLLRMLHRQNQFKQFTK